ncbi:MAG: YchJ family protein [Gemmatimonadales bacterium]|nr:YchJ family protein [Gemmatimonadales bacterium]
MEEEMDCPCGSQLAFDECCHPIISGDRPATTAEELMRARYSAYTQVEMDFLFDSLHPDQRDENDREGVRDWAENSEWHGLEIKETEGGGPEDETGKVEFVASYTYEGKRKNYEEEASFDKIDGNWYFSAGKRAVQKPIVRDEPKVGRNDPCPCWSGKKFKRCCGG